MAMSVKVTTDKCVSYWLPIPKNGINAVNKAISHCREGHRVDHEDSKYKWVVIRNPFAKLYSCWCDKVHRKNTFLPELRPVFKPGAPFSSFVDWVIETPDENSTNRHWRSQDNLLAIEGFKPDMILRFETLATDWRILADTIGLNPVLTKDNCTRRDVTDHTVHVPAYTESLRRKVAVRYRADFDRFGYDPEKL